MNKSYISMKAYWHTKTLFIQGWKYKWACKYEHCIECWQTKFKHKWRWLCTSCWEKERDKTERRKEVKYKAWHKWHIENKPKKPREEWKKMWPKPTGFDRSEYGKQWYQKNREVILLLNKWKVRKRKWLPVIEILGKYIPYINLEKPPTLKWYDEWKQNQQIFDKIIQFINK